MSLKPKEFPISNQGPVDKPALLSGPWGRINSSPGSVEVIRVCQRATSSNQRTHSYPYRVLSSWHWSQVGDEEKLSINASADVITARGRGLDRLVEALERGSLEILAESVAEDADSDESSIFVSSIAVAMLEDKE